MNFLSRLKDSVRGNILIVFAVSLPTFIGAAGLSTDTILWALWKREIQRSADSAAMAGALTVQQARYKAERASIHDFKKSKAFQAYKAQMFFENSPHQGPWKKDDNAVLVRVRMKTSLPFSQFFLDKPVFIEAEAVATMVGGTENCLIALEKGGARALEFTGSANVKLNCSATSNSGSPQAAVADGNAVVSAPFVYAVGGIPASGHFQDSKLEPFSPPQVDPFKDLPSSRAPSQCDPLQIIEPKQTKTFSPGCYSGFDIKGTAIFSPGVYFVTANGFNASSHANARGAGVTFVLSKSSSASSTGDLALYSQLVIEGGASLDFSAPTDGEYKNVLFHQDPNAPYNHLLPNRISGSSLSKLSGAFYFPNQPVVLTGNVGLDLGCFKIVARTITLTGSANLSNTCAEPDDRMRSQRVRLVN